MMCEVQIATLNCRGLGSIEKRNDMFDRLRILNCDIYCLQDTHWTEEQRDTIKDHVARQTYLIITLNTKLYLNSLIQTVIGL